MVCGPVAPLSAGAATALAVADPPDGFFTAVSAGEWHSCGLRADRVIVCWGHNRHGQAEPPNKLTAVTTGHRHSCGLRADGIIVCWGDNTYVGRAGQPGEFTAVSAGLGIRVVCGPMASSSAGAATQIGTATMWVRLTHPTEISRRSPPDSGIRVVCGPMAPSSAGASTARVRLTHPTEISRRSPPDRHSCGLRADGIIVCWGYNGDAGQADPPDGIFTAVSAGYAAFVWFAGRWHHRLLGQLQRQRPG